MYKISVNEHNLLLTKDAIKTEKTIPFESPRSFEKVINLLWNDSIQSANIYHSDVQELWKSFRKNFKYIEACGGLVHNAIGQILFIHRLGKWDLPKGKIEKGENPEAAAIREVEEECGISDLKIIRQLKTTYHIYHNEKHILKSVHWYEMYTEDTTPLTPQKEENILKAVWKNLEEIAETLENTYNNIQMLFDEGGSSKVALKTF